MTEPDVALTDYALVLECTIFAWLLGNTGKSIGGLNRWMVSFFAAVAVASLAGGTLHGFFSEDTAFGHTLFWSLSMLAVGVTALSGWAIGARLIMAPELAVWVIRAASLQLIIYTGVVLLVNDAFWVAIVDYLPAALFLLAAFAVAARRRRSLRVSMGAWGMALALAAAVLQQMGVAIHPFYFNHNSLYHLLQGIALALVFVACRGLPRPAAAEWRFQC